MECTKFSSVRLTHFNGSLGLAGRHIGQDIMGTMTNILLFSYLSGSLAMVLIYLKMRIHLLTISMNWSLEMTRALTGGIGIVLTIPITIGLMVTIFKWKGKSMTTIFTTITFILMVLLGGKRTHFLSHFIFKFYYSYY